MSILKEYVKSEKETEIVSKFREDYFKKYSTFLIRKSLINKNSIIVDVPCSTGGMSKEISKKINPKKFILMDINPEMIKGPWTEDEDRTLIDNVSAFGAQNWTKIAQSLPGRIGK